MNGPVSPGRLLPPPRRGRLWFGILAGPMAWTVAQLAGYALAASSCLPATPVEDTAARIAVLALSLVGMAVTAWAGIGAWRIYDAERRARPEPGLEARERVSFMALAGVFTSTVSLLALLYFMTMSLLVNPCLRST